MKFLLDENVTHSLLKIFRSKNLSITTIQKEGIRGIKNGELCSYLKQNDYVLITFDKEFLNLWSFHKIKVILVDIHPATDPFIIPKFNQFLTTFNKKLPDAFLIMLREKEFKIRTL